MAIFHSYSDESGKKGDSPVITFSCVCLPYSKLAGFDSEWEALLRGISAPYLRMAKASRYHRSYGALPKQTLEERIEALKPFADCINKYFEIGTMIAIDVSAFRSMPSAAKNALLAKGKTNDPYYMCFMRSILELLRYIQPDDQLSVICDDDTETGESCWGFYQGMKIKWPELAQKMICLGFADDKFFPSLQAADMLAYLFRAEALRVIYREYYEWVPLFNALVTMRGPGYTKWYEHIGDKQKLGKLGEEFEKMSSWIEKNKNEIKQIRKV